MRTVMRPYYHKMIVTAVLCLLSLSQHVGGASSSSRSLRQDLSRAAMGAFSNKQGSHEQLRRRLMPILFRTYDDAWKTAGGSTTDVYATTLESTCFKSSKSSKSSKRSGSRSGSSHSTRYCSGSSKSSKSSKRGSKSSRSDHDYDQEPTYPTPGTEPTYPTPSYPTPGTEPTYPTPGTEPTYPTPGTEPTYPTPTSPTPGTEPTYPTPTSPTPGTEPSPSTPTTPTPGTEPTTPSTPTVPGGTEPAPEPTGPGTEPTPTQQRNVCQDFFAGNAPTDGPSRSFNLERTIQIDTSVDVTTVLAAFTRVLNEVVAPDILGCLDQTSGRRQRQRQLQQTGSTLLTNAEFSAALAQAQSNCNPSPTITCVRTAFGSTIYWEGDEPTNLMQLIIAAIQRNRDAFSQIPGWRGFADAGIIVEVTDEPPRETPDLSTPSPTPIQDGQIPIVQGRSTGDGDEALSAGGYVGVSVAGLVLLLILLFACRSRRGRGISEEEAMKHRQFTADDESDGLETGEGDHTRDMTRSFMDYPENESHDESYDDRLVHIVGEDNSILNESFRNEQLLFPSQKVGEGQSLKDLTAAAQHHSCSSPTCEICEQRRQEGVNFVRTATPPQKDVTLPLTAERSYLSNDTIEL